MEQQWERSVSARSTTGGDNESYFVVMAQWADDGSEELANDVPLLLMQILVTRRLQSRAGATARQLPELYRNRVM